MLSLGSHHDRVWHASAGEQVGKTGRSGDLVPRIESLEQRRLNCADALPEMAIGGLEIPRHAPGRPLHELCICEHAEDAHIEADWARGIIADGAGAAAKIEDNAACRQLQPGHHGRPEPVPETQRCQTVVISGGCIRASRPLRVLTWWLLSSHEYSAHQVMRARIRSDNRRKHNQNRQAW